MRREAVRARPARQPTSSTRSSTAPSPSATCSASTTSSARSRWRTCSCSGSPTRCSSRCGTAASSRTCRSRWRRSFGVEGRGRFYESVGALRDVVQNHLLQVVALLAMEPPAGADAAALRDERSKLFRQIRTVEPGGGGAGAVPRLHRRGRGRPGLGRGDVRRPRSSRSTRGAGRACRGSSAPASTCPSPPPRRWSSSTPRPACCSRRPVPAPPHPNHLRFRLG